MVIKVPDGSFSRGIVKVDDQAELEASARVELLKQSALVLAQAYFTEYDSRIGVLNRKPLYAPSGLLHGGNHWQIYQHGESGREPYVGGLRTLPIHEVPAKVLEVAVTCCYT